MTRCLFFNMRVEMKNTEKPVLRSLASGEKLTQWKAGNGWGPHEPRRNNCEIALCAFLGLSAQSMTDASEGRLTGRLSPRWVKCAPARSA
jgi:hypothetical protein